MPNEIVEALLELGLTPIDWVDASQFSKLTGIDEDKLTHRRKKWQQDLVWTKQDGNIYYSIKDNPLDTIKNKKYSKLSNAQSNETCVLLAKVKCKIRKVAA